MIFEPKDCLISDGQDYLFYHTKGKGLFKLTNGDGVSKTPGAIRSSCTTKEVKDYNNVSMVYFDERLFIRHEGIKPAPFEVWNPFTLKKNEELSK